MGYGHKKRHTESTRGKGSWNVRSQRVSLMETRFRWVECQLTALRGCRDREDVDETLDGLPESLDDTYHRILNSIVRPKDQKRAQRVLQLIAVSYRPLTI